MTDRYAVFGNPISHSKSPSIHGQFARQTGQDMSYQAECIQPDAFENDVRSFFAAGGKGLNITVPFKERAFAIADTLSPQAREAAAVNTLIVQADGQVMGDNTDGIGLLRDITDNLGWSLSGQRVLVLGAGGAVRGILSPLLAAGPESIWVANRTRQKAIELAAAFAGRGNIRGSGFDELDKQQFDVVINGTSASLSGEMPPLPENLLADGARCYDMMYGARPTVFMQWAQGHGAQFCADGLGMLVEQGAEAFQRWRGVRPETAPVIAALRAELAGG